MVGAEALLGAVGIVILTTAGLSVLKEAVGDVFGGGNVEMSADLQT